MKDFFMNQQEDTQKKKTVKQKFITESGEEIIYKTHPCRRGWHNLKKYILAFILLAVAAYIFIDTWLYIYLRSLDVVPILLYVLIALTLLIIIATEIKRNSIAYYLTSSRCIAERGIFAKKTNSIHLSIVDSIKVETNFIDRIFRMGDLKIGVVGECVEFKDVHNPNRLEERITRTIDNYRRRLREGMFGQ